MLSRQEQQLHVILDRSYRPAPHIPGTAALMWADEETCGPGRMAVALVFPMFMVSVIIIRSVILFKRGAIRDKEVSLHLRSYSQLPCAWQHPRWMA